MAMYTIIKRNAAKRSQEKSGVLKPGWIETMMVQAWLF